MAENILETRILLRCDSYDNWMASNVILLSGEVAIAKMNYVRTLGYTNATPENTPPAIGLKVGDGVHYFSELPWVQGVAADVYNWAKSAVKPSYTASEIQGLDNYIEEHAGGGSGSGTITARLYQLIQGTGDNENKYYLQSKGNDDTNWTIDTNHYIDLTDLSRLMEWISNDINNFTTLGNRIASHIQYEVG